MDEQGARFIARKALGFNEADTCVVYSRVLGGKTILPDEAAKLKTRFGYTNHRAEEVQRTCWVEYFHCIWTEVLSKDVASKSSTL